MAMMHIAFGLDLIALALGTGLLVWAMKNPGKGSWLGKLFGAIVVILSVISIVCLISCAVKGGDCHRPGEGMMMGSLMSEMPDQEGHDHMAKKMEHKK
ncbi:MAG TPA: hypothetical protein VLH77_05850 [Gammaproteobacteria bacterium]|nr:hypothetical protein [Gammaproteobacteria bacterium]